MNKSIPMIDMLKCAHCGGCTSVCPHNAIFLYDETKLEINENICRRCNLCTTFCPMNAFMIIKEGT